MKKDLTWSDLVMFVEAKASPKRWVVVIFNQYHMSFLDKKGHTTVNLREAGIFPSKESAESKSESKDGDWTAIPYSLAEKKSIELQSKYS